jgi:hypothetical protein
LIILIRIRKQLKGFMNDKITHQLAFFKEMREIKFNDTVKKFGLRWLKNAVRYKYNLSEGLDSIDED